MRRTTLSKKLRRKPAQAAVVAEVVVRPPLSAEENAQLLEAGRAALEADLARAAKTFRLDQVHPESTLLVMTDVARGEAGFTNGAQLREHWESPKIQRVSRHLSKDPPGDWCHVHCPDGKRIFIRFTSTRHQLLAADDETAGQLETDMADKLKKTSTKKPVKPVAAATKKKPGAAAADKPAKPAGNCKWLLDRLKAQASRAFSTDANRGVIKSGVASCESYLGVKKFLEKAGASDDAKFEAFLETFFGHCINR